MNFKGGKGIAATGGLVIALGDWRLLVIALGVFLITVIVTRYVSLGSVLGLITVFVTWTVLCATGGIHAEPYTAECCVIVFLLAALGIWQHRSNIARLLHGTENKLWGSRKSGSHKYIRHGGVRWQKSVSSELEPGNWADSAAVQQRAPGQYMVSCACGSGNASEKQGA